MQHADVEIPQEQAAIVTNAPESVSPVIAAPRVESHRRHPGSMALATCHDVALFHRPDGYQVILATCDDVFAIWRPADTRESAVVAAEYVQYSVLISRLLFMPRVETHSSFK